MTNSNKDPDWMMKLHELPSDWGVPSEGSISKAKDIIDWATQNNLDIESIDPDVLGGVAIYLNGINNRIVWISILNNRKPCVIFRCRPGSKVIGRTMDDSSFEELKLFLSNEEHSLCKGN